MNSVHRERGLFNGLWAYCNYGDGVANWSPYWYRLVTVYNLINFFMLLIKQICVKMTDI